MVQEVAIGDRLDRCTFLVRSASGSQGTGTLVSPDRLLTCAHLVEEQGERVSVFDHWSSEEPFVEGAVVKLGNPEGSDDLALIELDESLPGLGGLSFVHPERGESMVITGFPSGKKDEVHGLVGGDSQYGWLTVKAEGVTEGFSGAAVWSTTRKAAVGIVRGYDGPRKGHIIPEGVIRTFLPVLKEDPVEAITCDLTNLGDDRWVQVFDGAEGRLLGSGFRLSAKRVVTSYSVAMGSPTPKIQSFAATRGQGQSASVVWPTEPGQSEAVAVLQTEVAVEVLPFEIPPPSRLAPRYPWKTVFYPRKAEHSSERLGVSGLLSPSKTPGRWRVDSIRDGEGATPDPEAVKGSAVFVSPPEEPERWSLLGILGLDSEGKFEICGLDGLRAWPELQNRLDADRLRRSRNQVRRLLSTDPAARQALLDRDEEGDWRNLREDDEALASTLCGDTDPYVLTERTYNAFCDLLELKQSAAADQTFRILMASLPAALGKHWFFGLPEARATEIRLGLFGRVLVEFALAAAESGTAYFHDLPPGGTHFPLPTYQVPLVSPGELGYDPEYKDAINEIVSDVEARLPRGVDPVHLGRLIGRWATRPLDGDEVRWLDQGERPRSVNPRPVGSALAQINRELARPNRRRRRFYLLATQETAQSWEIEPLVAGLRQVLPELKIVTLEGVGSRTESFEDLLSLLKRLFHERRRQIEGRLNP